MLPAKQRFNPGGFAGGQAHLRLEREPQLAARNDIAQRLLGLGAQLMLALELVAEQAMLPAATRFGAVHGKVGGAHQPFDGRSMVGRHRDPDRGANIDAVTLKLERLGNRQRDPPRNHFDLGHPLDLWKE